jgi:Flp pilus assembly protein TadD
MRKKFVRLLFVAAVGACLAGCGTAKNTAALDQPAASAQAEPGNDALAEATPADAAASNDGLLGSDPSDDLSLGKKEYRAGAYGLAEQHFRRAAETHPADAEAWLGLAAAYDRLRRFDFADRAYAQAIKIVGPTPEILNNQGYSYLLRGDYKSADKKLRAAQAKAPDNPYVQNNLRLLADSSRQGKAVE